MYNEEKINKNVDRNLQVAEFEIIEENIRRAKNLKPSKISWYPESEVYELLEDLLEDHPRYSVLGIDSRKAKVEKNRRSKY